MNNEDLASKTNIVFYYNSYIDNMQMNKEWRAIRAFVFNFLFCQILLFVFKKFLYNIVGDTIDVLCGVEVLLMALFTLVEVIHLNYLFLLCFSKERIKKSLPTKLNVRFLIRYNWYANVILYLSLFINVIGIFLISYYDNLYYKSSITVADYYNRIDQKTITEFLDQFRIRSVVSEISFIIAFIICFVIIIFVFLKFRIPKKEIISFTLNELQDDLPETVKLDGVSIIMRDSSIVTLDLSQDDLKFLFGSLIIFNQTMKTTKIYLDSEIQKIMIIGSGINKEILYDINTKEWIVYSVMP